MSKQQRSADSSVFDHMFDHCHWDNPVFVHGIFWVFFLALTYAGTVYYKWKEANAVEAEKVEKEQEELKQARELAAKRR